MKIFTVSANRHFGAGLLTTPSLPFKKLFVILLKPCLLFTLVIPAAIHPLSAMPSQDINLVEINLELNSESLLQAFQKIEAVSSFHFMYRREEVKDIRNLTLTAGRRSIAACLKIILANTALAFKQVDRRILISLKTPQNTIVIQTSGEAAPASPEKPMDKVITGQVTDADGSVLQGVSITLKGATTGTSTDLQGRYRINAPDNSVLIFTFVGFETREIAAGSQELAHVKMDRSAIKLSEVVVTALGIRREAKSLGYATATVAPEQVTVNRTSNFMNALEGKIAGVNITSLGTGPAGTSKIRIRGQSSFGGNNSPLIIVNGVPIDNTNFGARGDAATRGSNRTSDGGDGLSSIDPDNIESMTVLKGAAAAALYGSRAKDGVIMITTKTRGRGNGIGVEYNVNYTNETPLDYTDYQYEYGQGENGVRPTTPNPTSGQWSFGEKFKPGITQTLFDGVEVPYTPQRHQITQYYRKANTLTNTVTISSGSEFGGFNLSLSNMTADAILPGSSYNRKNLDLGFTQTLAKKLTVSGNISYSNEKRTNPPNIGEQDYSPVVLFNMANSMPMDLLKKYAMNSNGDEVLWSRFTNRTNPYFALTRFDHILRDRVFGNITARYEFTKWLYLQGRIGQDYYTRSQDYNLPTGSQRQAAAPPGFVNGEYVQDVRRFRELNTDFLLGGKQAFGSFGIDVNVGGNLKYVKKDRNNVLVNDFYTRGLYALGNGRLLSPIYEIFETQVNSLYAAAELSYKGFIYVNGTARNDWFSTLSPQNRSILYPSVTGSFVFSEALRSGMPSWISFGKVRAAYAGAGSDLDIGPYANNLPYAINLSQFPNPSGTGQPIAGISTTTVPNPNLRPMKVTEKEIGLEMKLFKSKVSFELSYYNKLSSDQILQAQISDASGYLTQLINVGKSRNKGLEMLVNLSPVTTKSFNWNLSFNASYNSSKVLSLGNNVSDSIITVGTGDYSGELRQVVGKPIGQLYGYGYLRDEQGRQVFDAGNGRPLRTAGQIAFGSAVPVWIGGITNSFDYKGIRLSFLIDFKLGNKMISGTNFNAWREGLHKGTLAGREQGYVIGNGVNLNKQVNTTQSGVQAFYETVRSQNIAEEFVYNAGLWELRQITLGYDFTRYAKAVKFIKGLRVNAVANNVGVLKKWVPNIHPEQFGFPSDNLVGLESTGLPVTRSIGFNVNIKF